MLNYKKIIKRRRTRTKILRMLNFIPDKPMLMFQYWIKTGHCLNLKNPRRFTEKLQWYKLYYRNPQIVQCVDKYDVRDYVKSKGLEDILVPCYGVYDSVDEIEWNALPMSFVMKDTLGGGGTSVAIIQDKENANIDQLKERAKRWLSFDAHKKNSGREWPYYNGKNHRVLIEQYLSDSIHNEGINDYKFFCFNGKVVFIYVMSDRELGKKVKVGIFDDQFNKLSVRRVGDDELTKIECPKNFSRMKRIAEILSEDFPHVRVDLYNVNGNILFGELTFFNASGYMQYDPDSFDYEIGRKWDLASIQ